MGGDHGPDVVVPALATVATRRPDIRFIVYGREEIVGPILARFPKLAGVSELIHCEVAVRMDDKPSQALRNGRWKSSMWKAIEAVKNGTADACISAGNTGALMAISKFCLRTMATIDRPAIAAIWPTLRGESVVLDVGATIGADAHQSRSRPGQEVQVADAGIQAVEDFGHSFQQLAAIDCRRHAFRAALQQPIAEYMLDFCN